MPDRIHIFESFAEIAPFYPFQDTITWDDLKPTNKVVENTYLKSDIDADTWAAVLLTIDDDQGEIWTELAALCRQAVAYLVAYEHMDKANVIYSAAGLLVANTQGTVPASEARTQMLRYQLLKDSQRALDAVIRYLEENTAIFTDWATSNKRTDNKGLLIRTAAEMDRYYSIGENRWIWRKLIPWQRQVIAVELTAELGAELVADYCEKITFEEAEEYFAIRDRLSRALALLTVSRALPQLQVQFGPEGIAIFDSDYSLAKGRRQADDLGRVAYLANSNNERGRMELRALKNFLDETAGPTAYLAYYESPAYTDPTIDLTDTNDPDRENLLSL